MGAQIEIVLISLSARPRVAISGVVRLSVDANQLVGSSDGHVEVFREYCRPDSRLLPSEPFPAVATHQTRRFNNSARAEAFSITYASDKPKLQLRIATRASNSARGAPECTALRAS